MRLGVITDEKGDPVSHRTVLKLIFNPILRMFGRQIASRFNGKFFVGYCVTACHRRPNLFRNCKESWLYDETKTPRSP